MKQKIIPDDVAQEIVRLYKSGLKYKEIAKITGVSRPKISKTLKDNNVKPQIGGYRINKTVNKDYFKIWSHDMAWILGFVMADGYICDDGKRYYLSVHLGSSDICILEFIKSQIDKGTKILTTNKYLKRTNKTYEGKRLIINCKEIVKDLANLQVVQAKTGKECIPSLIPKEYIPSFLRGFFDGDGSVGLYKVKTYMVRNLQLTSMSLKILEAVAQMFPGVRICPVPKGQHYNLKTTRYDIIKPFYEFIYSTPGYFLQRKKDQFEKIMAYGGKKPRKGKKALAAA